MPTSLQSLFLSNSSLIMAGTYFIGQRVAIRVRAHDTDTKLRIYVRALDLAVWIRVRIIIIMNTALPKCFRNRTTPSWTSSNMLFLKEWILQENELPKNKERLSLGKILLLLMKKNRVYLTAGMLVRSALWPGDSPKMSLGLVGLVFENIFTCYAIVFVP